MRNITPAKTADVSASQTAAAQSIPTRSVSIRVSPNSYFIASFLGVFFAGFFVYLEKDVWASLLLGMSLIVLPVLAWTDRLVFDGQELIRTGILPRAWAALNSFDYSLRLSEIEQVETQALRALRRGGSILYRYRTSVTGKDLQLVFVSGGTEYRRMVHHLFPRLAENILDNRSIELRDYLTEPKEVLMKAQFACIPSADVLEDSIRAYQVGGRGHRLKCGETVGRTEREDEKVDYLRRLANELRLSGFLLQALEAFRRALVLNPGDGWLLFEFARCLHSFASAERCERLQRRALAVMRLAERRGAGDGDLMARLGESYFQFGDWRRARTVFQKNVDSCGANFRSFRGLAEIALREGKIAHVIHHFSAAARLAEIPALRSWTQKESDYFSHLNDDVDYMEMEISRINLLENLENAKRTTVRIACFGFPAILVGLVFSEELVANIGWAVTSVALLIWVGLVMSQNLFSSRIPYELIEEE